MAGFKLNEAAIKKVAEQAAREAAKQYQRLFDDLVRTHAGRPAAEIAPVLRTRWRRLGGDISDPELSEYAALISAGTRFDFKPGKR